MGRLILLLGGNQGNIMETFKAVYPRLEHHLGPISGFSGLYQSEPWGFDTDEYFINQVVEVECDISAGDILTITQSIEKDFGRMKNSAPGYTSRPLDIDILFYDDNEVDIPELKIPHPRLHERMFTLLPLMEKWGDFRHPSKNKTIRELTEECQDKGWVKKIEK